MQKRTLGNTDLHVAPLALGSNVFGWTIDEQQSFNVLDAFVSEGFNLVDTADVYSTWQPGNRGGESETIIGNWLKKFRNRTGVIIATKVGGDMGLGRKCLEKKYIFKAVEDSLRRLQTDYIDLYQSHFDDHSLPVTEPLEAYERLIKEGKVRHIGASNFSAQRLQEALDASEQQGLPRYQTFQPEYNLYNREQYEKEYEPLVTKNGLGVINYFALASGFLSGKYRTEADANKSARGGGVVSKYLNERGNRILKALDNVSGRYNTDPASVAIAWLIARPSITAPIASATSKEQLASLVKAARLQLDKEAITELNDASAY